MKPEKKDHESCLSCSPSMNSGNSELFCDSAVSALKETYANYQTIFENTGTATVIIEEDATISAVNSELERISGYRRGNIEGKMKFMELIAPEDREMVLNNHRMRRKDPESVPRNYQCKVLMEDKEIRQCILTVALISGTRRSVASITDISELRRLEQEIIRISEKERQKIGQDLHDDLGSHLAGVEAMCSLLTSRLEKQGNGEAGLAREISGLINNAIAKTRCLSRGLLPEEIGTYGLKATLTQYASLINKAFGVSCTVSGDDEGENFETSTLSHLYNITRESVRNAIQHGKAREISIKLISDPESLTLEIVDNGFGLPERMERNSGAGLNIMQHRAGIIGATLSIDSSQNIGTKILCRVSRKFF